MNDTVQLLLEKHPYLHWNDAVAMARILVLTEALQTEFAIRFPASNPADFLPIALHMIDRIAANNEEH